MGSVGRRLFSSPSLSHRPPPPTDRSRPRPCPLTTHGVPACAALFDPRAGALALTAPRRARAASSAAVLRQRLFLNPLSPLSLSQQPPPPPPRAGNGFASGAGYGGGGGGYGGGDRGGFGGDRGGFGHGGAGHGGSVTPSTFVAPPHAFGDTSGFPMSADEYRRTHDLVVSSPGGTVPEPLQTFEAAGFTPDIMREVS